MEEAIQLLNLHSIYSSSLRSPICCPIEFMASEDIPITPFPIPLITPAILSDPAPHTFGDLSLSTYLPRQERTSFWRCYNCLWCLSISQIEGKREDSKVPSKKSLLWWGFFSNPCANRFGGEGRKRVSTRRIETPKHMNINMDSM